MTVCAAMTDLDEKLSDYSEKGNAYWRMQYRMHKAAAYDTCKQEARKRFPGQESEDGWVDACRNQAQRLVSAQEQAGTTGESSSVQAGTAKEPRPLTVIPEVPQGPKGPIGEAATLS